MNLCLRELVDSDENKKIVIVATTTMIADLVIHIVGNHAIVYGLMGPGVDPHLYRARESDVHKLAAADIIFYNGLHLEGKMGQVLAGMNHFTRAVAVTDSIDKTLLRCAEFDGMYDPHVWFDVVLWKSAVRLVCDELVKIDPVHELDYKKNCDNYMQSLSLLDEYIMKKVMTIDRDRRILVTAHDAFGYFGARYGFDVVGLQGLSTDAEVGMHDITVLADFIVEKKVPVVFVESSVAQRTVFALRNAVNARGWCVAIGAELYSDALGDCSTRASDYCSMLYYTVDTIIDSLKA